MVSIWGSYCVVILLAGDRLRDRSENHRPSQQRRAVRSENVLGWRHPAIRHLCATIQTKGLCRFLLNKLVCCNSKFLKGAFKYLLFTQFSHFYKRPWVLWLFVDKQIFDGLYGGGVQTFETAWSDRSDSLVLAYHGASAREHDSSVRGVRSHVLPRRGNASFSFDFYTNK